MKKIEINVPGMQSAHCQARVNNAVGTIAGVQVLNVKAGSIEVGFTEESLETEVVSKIENAGYAVGQTNGKEAMSCKTGCCSH